jgi:hypothetical protein
LKRGSDMHCIPIEEVPVIDEQGSRGNLQIIRIYVKKK